jgi:superfamily I DNA/RNA helicase
VKKAFRIVGTARIGLIVLVVIAAIVYRFLTQAGVVLAISPVIEWLTWLLSVLSPLIAVLFDPFGLTVLVLLVASSAAVAWSRIDDIGVRTVEMLAQCKAWLGFDGPVVVRGSLEQGGVRWIGYHTRDRVTKVEHRACPRCAVELEPKRIEQTVVNRPNTPMTADKKTREREEQAWKNVFGREKSDTEKLVSALVCPRDTCAFSIQREKLVKTGRSAAKKQFRTHFNDEMRAGSSDPFGKWYQLAEERLESDLEPTPADLWDAYVPQSDDDAVLSNETFGHGLPGEDESVTCDALEKHKLDAEGVDQLIELFPDGFDRILAWLVRSGYLEKRREITRKMNSEMDTCQEELNRVEGKHGSMVQRILNARYNRSEPQIDLETTAYELDVANETVSELRKDLDSDYLPARERRWLSRIKNGIADAVEYVAQLRAFTEHRRTIDPTIDAFEERFEPYDQGENYMTTPDQKFLKPGCSKIHHQLTTLHDEVRLELLPEEMTEWAKEEKARFTGISEILEDYNETFVKHEYKRYRHLFETDHGLLNEEQQKAIVRNDMHNLVDASAGTGKTLTLTYRFLYLCRRGVPPDDIMAITFTRDAAEKMKDSIDDVLDGVDPDRLNISTCHSLAYGIVEDSVGGYTNDNDYTNIYKRYVKGFFGTDDVIQERHADEINTFKQYHNSLINDTDVYNRKPGKQSRQKFLRDQYTKFLKNARNDDQTPTEIQDRLTEDKRVQYLFGRAACVILAAFLDYAESSEEPVDFFDMVKSATRIRQENPDHFGGQYRHILFDEFQDVTESDLRFIETFLQAPGETRLFAVGDDWQSIYGFRGSDPRYFLEFDERFEGVKNTQLAINYRCPPAVVEAGVELMDNCESDQNEKAVEAFDDRETVPVIHKLKGIYKSRIPGDVVNLVEDALSESDMNSTDVMVLSRNTTGVQYIHSIRSGLAERGIPVDSSDDGDDPNGVRVQTIHTSKGTESECVILVNATDITRNGLPASEKENELIKPATTNRVHHYAEERRLFYVALTRTKNQFHVVTHANQVSRYLNDITDFCDEKLSVVTTVEGTVSQWDDPGANARKPITAILRCDEYDVNIKSWHRYLPRKLEEGQHYRLSDFEVEDNGYGEEIVLNEKIKIEELQPN